MRSNRWLIAGGILSAIAGLVHVGVILGGPSWYRFFGAGEEMAQAAERGSLMPAAITLAIAAVLLVWSLYAFSAAGLVRRLPLIRTALVLISAIYLFRGMAPWPAMFFIPQMATPFTVWSTLVVLVYGLTYAVGTWLAWPHLRIAGSAATRRRDGGDGSSRAFKA
ncbi:hypothetical protein [Sphingosinicella terrae]|uniref:hypothetical protein n=1 Tax=Sphingosinicella terrae TaxID=2172047 RepID=UPI002548F798|nr:hypothetical protein [Sphingosinicella terrae]